MGVVRWIRGRKEGGRLGESTVMVRYLPGKRIDSGSVTGPNREAAELELEQAAGRGCTSSPGLDGCCVTSSAPTAAALAARQARDDGHEDRGDAVDDGLEDEVDVGVSPEQGRRRRPEEEAGRTLRTLTTAWKNDVMPEAMALWIWCKREEGRCRRAVEGWEGQGGRRGSRGREGRR